MASSDRTRNKLAWYSNFGTLKVKINWSPYIVSQNTSAGQSYIALYKITLFSGGMHFDCISNQLWQTGFQLFLVLLHFFFFFLTDTTQRTVPDASSSRLARSVSPLHSFPGPSLGWKCWEFLTWHKSPKHFKSDGQQPRQKQEFVKCNSSLEGSSLFFATNSCTFLN